jgi:hypothetical protein
MHKVVHTGKKRADPNEHWTPKRNFGKFNASLLGLGDISCDVRCFEAIAAIFDLKGFTSFCDQRDPHLEVPQYLNNFLDWLFKRIAKESLKQQDENRSVLWYPHPFFAKFLGDGVLFLWDAGHLNPDGRLNIVQAFDVICSDYEKDFLPACRGKFTNPPPKLRCGIAKGQVTSIGAEKDFVGLCINIASRLQKLPQGGLSFAFTKKGFDLERSDAEYGRNFKLIKIPIRGVGKEELVYVLEEEFNALPEDEKKKLLP